LINSAASQRHVTLSADDDEHDVINVGLFTHSKRVRLYD